MNDDDLERRLRRDPTLDPAHEVGAFRDRLAARSVAGDGPGGRRRGRDGALLVAAAILIAVTLVVGRSPATTTTPGAGSPSPSVTSSVRPIPTDAIHTKLDIWAHSGPLHRATVSIVGPTGETWSDSSARAAEPALDSLATFRIGEMSRMLLVSAVVSLDECGRGLGFAMCQRPALAPPFSIDEPIARWFPEWPNGGAIPIRRLLDGTSGLAPVTTGMAQLLAQVEALPSAQWTTTALLDRARTLPPSFAPGAGFELTDTADLLLDAIVVRATGRESLFWIGSAAVNHFGLTSTTLPPTQPADLVPGTRADGRPLADLPVQVLAAVGSAGGIASNALDLARYASPAWSTSSIHDGSTIDKVVALDPTNRYGLGVAGFCPCPGGSPRLLGLTGHAAAWSGFVVKDTVDRWSIALLVDTDLTDVQLQALMSEVLSTLDSGT